MELRGISFGTIVNSPAWGTHPSMVSMTETLTLSGDERPRMRRKVKFGGGVAVSDGRGAKEGLASFLATHSWHKETKPFFIVFKPVSDTRDGRNEELQKAVSILLDAQGAFSVTYALVLDVAELPVEDTATYTEEMKGLLAVARTLGVPLVVKVSILLGPEIASDILLDPNADGLLLSDSVAWSDLPERAQKVFFRTTTSPLARVGGGVVQGKYLLPLAVEWVHQLKRRFAQKPIITGAGLLRPRDVNVLKEAGASAVAIGAVGVLRPWNGWRIIKRAHDIL